jgi:mono/diheme cytochrome c family protein
MARLLNIIFHPLSFGERARSLRLSQPGAPWARARRRPDVVLSLSKEPVEGVREKPLLAGRLRTPGIIVALGLAGLAATACVQQSNTYPVEIFKEMHYSQSARPQEPPRLAPPAAAVSFKASGADAVLDVPAKRERPYDLAHAKELYRVNCSACHGVDGMGDGAAAAHLTSGKSYFATKNGAPYPPPANLQQSLKRADFTPDLAFTTVSRGVVVMPRFGALLSEEDIREIVNYLFDKQNGIAAK